MLVSCNQSDESVKNKTMITQPVSQNSEKTTDYFRDRALDTKDEDKFKHLHYVEVLKDILLKSETPINIGLYGKWGVGKSSIVHMLKEAIDKTEELKKFKYVEIDAWGLSGVSLQQEILEETNIQLGKKAYKQNEIEDELYNVQQVDIYDFSIITKSWKSRKFLGVCLPIVVISILIAFGSDTDLVTKISAIGLSSILALLFPLTRLFVGTSKRIIPRATSSLKFKEIYKKITDESGEKIVVVIDNLDRCNDEIAVELLGLIQTFMVKKNCINILTCDDEAIITHLRNVKGEQYTDKDGNEFLSKFFQVTLRIPPFIGENLEKYTEDLMNRRSVPFKRFVRQILISGAVENPRKINQFLNNAVALYRLAELKERDQKLPKGVITEHTDFLIKMIIIRHEWPEFYKKIEEQPNILDNDEHITELQSQENNSEKENHSLRALKKFLNRTQISHVDDVIPFLRLNQESYAAESGMDEFGTAVSTLDSTAEKIFTKSEKQNQYLKKIENLMDENAEKGDLLTLVNCALSLIGILRHVENPEEREFALATLGRHLSNSLLNEWDKFDLDRHNIFEHLEEMHSHLSTKFYKRLIHETFPNEKINDRLLFQFMKNGGKISANIMDMIDDQFSKSILNSVDNIEFVVKCCEKYNWDQNNISKPSKTISKIIDHIIFDSENDDSLSRTAYEKIKKRIHRTEREKFLEKVKSTISEFASRDHALPTQLIDVIKEISEDLDENISQKENIFKTLSDSIKEITDREQSNTLFNIIINLAEKFEESDDISVDVNVLLERATIAYLDSADHDSILTFLHESNTRKQEFLKSNVISIALVERFIATDPHNKEILRHLLKDTPYESQDSIARKLNELILSKDPNRYSALLEVAQELDKDFNYSIIDSIRETCKEVASEDDSDRLTFYKYVLNLKPSFYDTQEIVRYSKHLIADQDPAKQDTGLELLQLVNTNRETSDIHGIGKAIEQSIVFLQENSARVNNYLSFILQYSDRWSFFHQTKLKEIFKEGLKPERSEQILNIILSHISTAPEKIIKDILDELIECAQQTSYDNAKEQILQILIRNKQALRWRQKNKIEEMYGEIVLD